MRSCSTSEALHWRPKTIAAVVSPGLLIQRAGFTLYSNARNVDGSVTDSRWETLKRLLVTRKIRLLGSQALRKSNLFDASTTLAS